MSVRQSGSSFSVARMSYVSCRTSHGLVARPVRRLPPLIPRAVRYRPRGPRRGPGHLRLRLCGRGVRALRLLERRARPLDPVWHLLGGALRRGRDRLRIRPTPIEQRANLGRAAAPPVLLLLRVGRARGHQRGQGRVRVVMRGQHVRRHRWQPPPRLLLLLLLGERGLGGGLCGVRGGRGCDAVLLELVDVHDRPPFVWELLWARARVRALEQAALIAELRTCGAGC